MFSCIQPFFFVHSFVDGPWSCFLVFAVLNNAAGKKWCRYLFNLLFPFSLDIYTVGLQDHIIDVFSTFQDVFILISIVAISVYISRSTTQWFAFLYILTSICLFASSHSNRCEAVSHVWLWFAFLSWLLMFNIYSTFTCWPSTCLLW